MHEAAIGVQNYPVLKTEDTTLPMDWIAGLQKD